jgi:hypothetical protein
LRIIAGPHEGRAGVAEKLLLRHLQAYLINVDDEKIQAADDQVGAA